MRRLSYICVLAVAMIGKSLYATEHAKQPNILFVISDDQSYPHASAYGARGISTPGFDQVAREGVLVHHAIAGSPGCAPSRATVLTGRYPWQNQHAGTHASSFPAELDVYPELLSKHGYHAVSYTHLTLPTKA